MEKYSNAEEITFKNGRKIIMLDVDLVGEKSYDKILKEWGLWDSVEDYGTRTIYHKVEYCTGYASRNKYNPLSWWRKKLIEFAMKGRIC